MKLLIKLTTRRKLIPQISILYYFFLFIIYNITLQTYINWYFISQNPNDLAVDLLLQQQDLIRWQCLSSNSNDRAVDLLLQNPDKIYWSSLSKNLNTKAVQYLLQNIDKINWDNFSSNPNELAVDFLLQHIEKINYKELAKNPNPRAVSFLLKDIYDFPSMKRMNADFTYELIEYIHNPDRILNICKIYSFDFLSYLYVIE